MSNADQEDLVTTSSDGVTVEKSFEPDDFPVPAIAFVVRSDRDETVSVRLVDFVPDDVPPEDIGFHPNYGAEFWDVEGDTIVFTRDLNPDEEYTTVYGLRGGDAADAEKFMTEPEIESVDPPLPADSGEAVREVMEDDDEDSTAETDGRQAESGSGADDIESAISRVDEEEEAESGDDEPDTSLELNDPADASTEPAAEETVGDTAPADASTEDPATDDVTADASAGNGAATDAAGAGGVAIEGSLAETLADEIRSGDVDDDDLETLRDALGVEDTSGSVEARIDHLQSEMADVEAYADAIEEFLDENGTAQQLLDDLRSELEATQERLDAIEGTAEEAVETAQSVEAELEDFEAEADDETEERLDELESEIESLSDELEDVAELRSRLASAIGGLDDSDDE